VRTKVKKGVMESISRAVGDFRHHNHKVNIMRLLTEQRDYVFCLNDVC